MSTAAFETLTLALIMNRCQMDAKISRCMWETPTWMTCACMKASVSAWGTGSVTKQASYKLWSGDAECVGAQRVTGNSCQPFNREACVLPPQGAHRGKRGPFDGYHGTIIMADAANAAYILKSTTPTPILASMSNGGGKVRCASQHSCVYYTEKALPGVWSFLRVTHGEGVSPLVREVPGLWCCSASLLCALGGCG